MLRRSMTSPPSTAFPVPGRLLASAGLPRRVFEALEMALELVAERITTPLAHALPALADQVSAIGDFGARHRVNIDAVDASTRLTRDGGAMTRLFLGFIERELAALRDPRPEPAPSADDAPVQLPSFSNLRLVDEDEDDTATVIGAIALRHESRASLPLQLLCQRFGVLAASPAFESATVPVGPRRLAELLAEATAAAGFGLQLTAAVLRHFDRHVLSAYPDFVETLNGLLSRLGVMPGLSYVPLRSRPRPAETREGAAERGLPTFETVPVEPHHAHARTLAGADGADLGFDEADPAAFDLLRQMLAARRGLAERFRRSGPASRPAPQIDHRAVVDLLDQADPAHPPGDFEAVRQWLLLQARQHRGEAVALNAADADTLELLGLLYGRIADDVRPGTAAAAMLDQLRLPLARLALRDRGFFVHASHPARQLLNAVAEAGAVWQSPEDVDPQFLLHVEHAVQAVARAREDVEAGFSKAADALDAQQQAQTRRAEMAERRSVEAARGKERLAVARRRATDVIDNAISGLKLPVFHRNMLRQAWADVLTLAHLRHGEEAEEWLTLVGDTRDLALAGATGEPAPEALAAQVEQWLVTVGHHMEDAARIARILTASAEEERDDAASRTELAMRLKARARLGEENDVAATTLPPRSAAEESAYRRLRTLPFGTWMTFKADDGSIARRRLAWWSPTTDAALFVNSRGQRAVETTLDAVAREVAADRARVVTGDAGLVDRAWRGVVRSLRSVVRGPAPGREAVP